MNTAQNSEEIAWRKRMKQMKLQQRTGRKITTYLRRKHGYQYIGNGAFSTVLRQPNAPTCIKVNRERDAWPLYILWAAQNGFLGTYAPAVYAIRHLHCGTYIAEMEYIPFDGEYLMYRDLDRDNVFKRGIRAVDMHHDICPDNMRTRTDGSWCVTDPTGARTSDYYPQLARDYPSLRVWHPMELQKSLAFRHPAATMHPPAHVEPSPVTLGELIHG